MYKIYQIGALFNPVFIIYILFIKLCLFIQRNFINYIDKTISKTTKNFS